MFLNLACSCSLSRVCSYASGWFLWKIGRGHRSTDSSGIVNSGQGNAIQQTFPIHHTNFTMQPLAEQAMP